MGMLRFFQSIRFHHTLTLTCFAHTFFVAGPGTQEQVLANTKETARNQFVVPLVNRK